jgi:hypothetical protein
MMAIGDKAGLETIKEFNEQTLPKLQALVDSFLMRADKILDEDLLNALGGIRKLESLTLEDVNALLDRLDGSTITLKVPGRK